MVNQIFNINTLVYIIYILIAVYTIIIAKEVSYTMGILVIAIELVRILAIYKKAISVIWLVFILNVSLIGYNSYKNEFKIAFNNNQIIKNNELTTNYLSKNSLRASTFKDLQANIKQIDNVEIEWYVNVIAYIFLELSLIFLILKINKTLPRKPKKTKALKQVSTKIY